MMNLSGQLRNLVEVWGKVKTVNKSGATKYEYALIKEVYAKITPYLSYTSSPQARSETAAGGDIVTGYALQKFKFIMRVNAVNIEPDMFFKFRGQVYDVIYSVPYFADGSYMEVYATIRIENEGEAYQGSEFY